MELFKEDIWIRKEYVCGRSGKQARGETPHFEYIAKEMSKGLATLNLEFDIPIVFGVLTTDTLDQALDRAGGKSNKGAEAAESLIEMMNLLDKLEKS